MVYLLHFDRAIGSTNPHGRAQHYIGYARRGRLHQRLEQHFDGNGARIMAAVSERGIEWELVRVWSNGTRTLERQLKNRKRAASLCPYCSQR